MSKSKNRGHAQIGQKQPGQQSGQQPAQSAQQSQAITLEAAQSAAKAQLTTRSDLQEQVVRVLASSSNKGKALGPDAIAVAISKDGPAVTRKDVRRSLQKMGLSRDQQGLVEIGTHWIYLEKVSGKNTYRLVNKGQA